MTCKNCNTPILAEQNYCPECGAKVIRNRLTLKNLFQNFTETFFNYDNKLLQTFLNLFKKPEDVIGSYIDGVRKKYANPISYFGIAITVSGLYLLIANKFFPEVMDYTLFSAPEQEEFQKRNVSFVQEYQSLFMMLYVPIYAIMARVSFLGYNKFNYTELVVVFLYIQGQMSIVSGILGIIAAAIGINQGIFSLYAIPVMILYSAYCLKRLYSLNFINIVLRTILFLVILMVLFVMFSILMAVVMYLNGDLQTAIEAQKAATGK
ncbi:DUF3667 domain-containing protein [Flavobacteriaceae bacterium SZ-1-7]|uniref:DUF3667 domain-containing protein n=1 Tax=Tamlana sedimenti TaxID=3134126 RepID=UPI0031232842